jgi:molybdopterin molybdotransferase
MQSLETALEQILAALPAPQSETVPLARAGNRVLTQDCVASVNLPAFDNSAMDGYAVRVTDVAAAAATHPVRLRLQAHVAAGDFYPGELSPGSCIRVFTGSPLPRGADAVIMQEDTRVDPITPAEVNILDTARPWENIRFQGEDIKQGALAVTAGLRLNPGRLSLLSAVGVSEVQVGRQPRIGLLATGTELQESGPLAPGKTFESNRICLAALTAAAGGLPRAYPLVNDTPAATRDALAFAFSECDIVITSGGVSVGDHDYVKSAFTDLGGQLDFWRVAIKPGRPFAFGRWQEKFLFGLPGNPISALITFLLLARPALLRWQGATQLSLPSHPAILKEPLANHGNRRHFIRVCVDDAGLVTPAGPQASHMLSPLAMANALVDVPPETTLPAGETIRVLRWEFS